MVCSLPEQRRRQRIAGSARLHPRHPLGSEAADRCARGTEVPSNGSLRGCERYARHWRGHTAPASPRWRTRGCSSRSPEEFEQVVHRAEQPPLGLHLLEPAQQELAKASRTLDLPQHRLGGDLALVVLGSAVILRLSYSAQPLGVHSNWRMRSLGERSSGSGSAKTGCSLHARWRILPGAT